MTKHSVATSGILVDAVPDGDEIGISIVVILCCWFAFALACVKICDLRFVDCANFFEHPSKGQT